MIGDRTQAETNNLLQGAAISIALGVLDGHHPAFLIAQCGAILTHAGAAKEGEELMKAVLKDQDSGRMVWTKKTVAKLAIQ